MFHLVGRGPESIPDVLLSCRFGPESIPDVPRLAVLDIPTMLHLVGRGAESVPHVMLEASVPHVLML